MTLSEELTWRGFVNQTTYKDIRELDKEPIVFYLGIDPSADSMTVGHLAMAMMIKHFIGHGHKAVLLVGGATGLIGDPDGKTQERDLKSLDEIAHNKAAIAQQYRQIFAGQDFSIVDNYDWFKDLGYLQFLRDVGKHVPMRQMLSREFVQSRLGEQSDGISYAEFSYSLIQGYDFLHLYREHGVHLQLCGSDQWGNSIAGVELIRRMEAKEAHVWSAPLIMNKATGVKFGKSEAGAIWLDSKKTSVTQFYQFWINVDDQSVEDYLKIYTLLSEDEVAMIIKEHDADTQVRSAQTRLAQAVTLLVHGEQAMQFAELVTNYLIGKLAVGDADKAAIDEIRLNMNSITAGPDSSIIEALSKSGLASSNSDARRLLNGNAISIDGQKITRENFETTDFKNGRLLLRRGKAYKDSILVELYVS